MRIYRLHINSDDKKAGTWANGFYSINIASKELDKDYDWFLSLEAFVINQTLPTAYIISLPDISIDGSSYSTLENGVKNIVLLNNQPFYFAAVSSDSTGNHIGHVSQFNGNSMRVLISDANTGVPYTSPPITSTIKWSMILVLHGIKKD